MPILALLSTTSNAQPDIPLGVADPSNFSAFTSGAQTSRWVYVGLCLNLQLRIMTDADSTGTAQWETTDNPNNLAGSPARLAPGTALVTNPKLDGSVAGQAGQVPTGRLTWIRLSVLTNTAGGPIRGAISGWSVDRPIY